MEIPGKAEVLTRIVLRHCGVIEQSKRQRNGDNKKSNGLQSCILCLQDVAEIDASGLLYLCQLQPREPRIPPNLTVLTRLPLASSPSWSVSNYHRKSIRTQIDTEREKIGKVAEAELPFKPNALPSP